MKKINAYKEPFNRWCNCFNFPHEMCDECDDYFTEQGYETKKARELKKLLKE